MVIEGGYSDNKDDSGGKTRWGVTEEVARRHGYQGKMSELPQTVAAKIYTTEYWDSLNLNAIEGICPAIAEELFDTGVNLGTYRAATFLQRSLNVLNLKQGIYKDIKVDGKLGYQSLLALMAYRDARGDEGLIVLHRALNCLQGAFYIELTERREKDETFIYGWLLNRVV